MEIIEGKFYKTRDGRKVGPAFVNDFGTSVFGSKENYESAVWTDTGRAGLLRSVEQKANDIVAEWQDEPKKEVSDMSEVKFKVGDLVTQKETKDYVYKVIAVDREGLYTIEIVEDIVSSMVGAIYSSVTDRNLELFTKKIATPEPNTKWVFNDGQDFVVRVVGFNDKGQIVLETVLDKHGFDLGNYFTFENEPENFGEFYKPWAEKTEKQKIVGYVTVVKNVGTGHIDFDASVFDTEKEARDGFDSWDGAWELVDVVKVEWSESSE